MEVRLVREQFVETKAPGAKTPEASDELVAQGRSAPRCSRYMCRSSRSHWQDWNPHSPHRYSFSAGTPNASTSLACRPQNETGLNADPLSSHPHFCSQIVACTAALLSMS